MKNRTCNIFDELSVAGGEGEFKNAEGVTEISPA
jgi:hypothetical protein